MQARRLDVGIEGVNEVYEGPGGALWELLMGEEIHVGGEADTELLAQKAGITAETLLLDVCSALGGPARHLAKKIGCQVVGLDATPKMHQEAIRRTREAGLEDRVSYRLGNALDMPFRRSTFDVVWGQDAWCYVTDKGRLLLECARVVKPGGLVAYTDWIETGPMSDDTWTALNTFMVFPYMETLPGYLELTHTACLEVLEAEDLSSHFACHVQRYLDDLTGLHKPMITQCYGEETYTQVQRGLTLWRDASAAGQVGRARIIARKRP